MKNEITRRHERKIEKSIKRLNIREYSSSAGLHGIELQGMGGKNPQTTVYIASFA